MLTGDPWLWWNKIRLLCESHSLLGVVLDVPESLPPKQNWKRWLGEPVKAAILSTNCFMTNKRGFPALSKAHQELLTCLFQHNVQVLQLQASGFLSVMKVIEMGSLILARLFDRRHGKMLQVILSGRSLHNAQEPTSTAAQDPSEYCGNPVVKVGTDPGADHPLRIYWEYLSYLFRKIDAANEQELIEIRYRDYLQVTTKFM